MASLISLYPRPTLFFLNAWTWGYEDMLKGVAKAFGAKVHVDRYKAHMYECARAEDPFLADIVTKDPESTRFHACERAHKCQVIMNAERNARNGERNLKSDDTVSRHKQAKTDRETEPPAPQDSLGPPVVYVNALEVSLVTWEKMMADQKEKIMEAKAGKSFWPRSIVSLLSIL